MTKLERISRLHREVLACRDKYGNDAVPLAFDPNSPVSLILMQAGGTLTQAAELLRLAGEIELAIGGEHE